MNSMTGGVFVKAKRAQTVDDDESWKEGGVSPTLNAFDNNSETRATVLQTFAFQPDDRAGKAPSALRAVATGVAPTIGTGDGYSDQGLRVLAPTLTASNDPSRSPQSSEVTQQVEAVHATGFGVRRLTPRECERLQGWPDDHTRYTVDGTEVPDSARYRMAGNGVAAPVAKYVAECIDAILGDSDGR